MHTITRELRSLPIGLLRKYLEELGGRITSDDCISGEGWQARLTQLEDFIIDSLHVAQVRLEWRGNEQAYQTCWQQLEQKLIAHAER